MYQQFENVQDRASKKEVPSNESTFSHFKIKALIYERILRQDDYGVLSSCLISKFETNYHIMEIIFFLHLSSIVLFFFSQILVTQIKD